MRLAQSLGKTMTDPAIMNMTEDEREYWMAFYTLEPWGCEVEDQRVSFQMDLFYQAHNTKGNKVPVWFNRDPSDEEIEEASAEKTAEQKEAQITNFFKGIIAAQKKQKAEQAQIVDPPISIENQGETD